MIAKYEAAPQIIHWTPAMSSVSPRSVLNIKFHGPKARWSEIDFLLIFVQSQSALLA